MQQEDPGALLLETRKSWKTRWPRIINKTTGQWYVIRIGREDVENVESKSESTERSTEADSLFDGLAKLGEIITLSHGKSISIKDKEPHYFVFYTCAALIFDGMCTISVWGKKMLDRSIGKDIVIQPSSERCYPMFGSFSLRSTGSVSRDVLKAAFGHRPNVETLLGRRRGGVRVKVLPQDLHGPRNRRLYLDKNKDGEAVASIDPKEHDPTLRLADIVAIFPSIQFEQEQGIVILAARQSRRNTALDVVCWRIALLPQVHATQEDLINFLLSKSVILNYGIADSVAAVPFLQAIAKSGEMVPYLGPVFGILHFAVSTNSSLETNISDLISFLDAWRRLKPHIELEADIQKEVMRIAESYFSKSRIGQWRDAADLADALKRLRSRIQSAVNAELVKEMADIKATLEDFTKRIDSDIVDIRDQLEEMKDSLSQEITPTTQALPPPILPEAPKLFDRERVLEELRFTFERSGTMAALVGVAGTGKTHCAKCFARHWIEEDRAGRTGFWLSADTEINIRSSYLMIMDRLGITLEDGGRNLNTCELASRVWAELERTSYYWLLVLDGVPESVDGPVTFAPWFFPRESMNQSGRILLTTRSNAYSGRTCLGHIARIKVDPLEKDQAMAMLLQAIARDNDELVAESEAAAAELVDYFNGLPLAIATASIEMNNRCITVKEYLDCIKKARADGLTLGTDDAITTAIASSLKRARQDGLADVLDVAAYVNPTSMPLKLFRDDRVAVQRLLKRNLLVCVGIDVFSMNLRFQEAARKDSSPSEAIVAVERSFKLFNSNDPTTLRQGLDILPHAEALHGFVKRLGGILCLDSLVLRVAYSWIVHTSGLVLHALGHYQEALARYEEALEMQQHLSDSHARDKEFAAILTDLGSLHFELGNLYEARAKIEAALEVRRQIVEDQSTKDIALAGMLNNLGLVYRRLGNYGEAIVKCEEALHLKRCVYGVDAKSPDLARTIINLGNLYSDTDRYEQARAMYEEGLEMLQHIYGADAYNADLARTLNNLGALYSDMGDYEQAQAMYEDGLKRQRDVYGADAKNADLARTLSNLGLLYCRLGNYEEALVKFEEMLEIQLRVCGVDAKNANLTTTSTALSNLGHAHHKLGNYEEALVKYEEALAVQQRTCSANDVELLRTMLNIANLQSDLGNYEEARDQYEKVLEMAERAVGKSHPLYEQIQKSLGALQSVEGAVRGAHGSGKRSP